MVHITWSWPRLPTRMLDLLLAFVFSFYFKGGEWEGNFENWRKCGEREWLMNRGWWFSGRVSEEGERCRDVNSTERFTWCEFEASLTVHPKNCVIWVILLKNRRLQVICGNHYKGSKIRIILLIEYLKARTLFEIRITPQTRLIMSSLNDSTCNLNYVELQRNLAIG